MSHIYISVVIVSFLCSLVSFRLHYPFHLKLISILLAITVITEIIANFFLTPFHLRSNFPVYNIYMLIEYPLLALYFRQIIISKIFKKTIGLFLILYPVLWCVIFLFVFHLNEWMFGLLGMFHLIFLFYSHVFVYVIFY